MDLACRLLARIPGIKEEAMFLLSMALSEKKRGSNWRTQLCRSERNEEVDIIYQECVSHTVIAMHQSQYSTTSMGPAHEARCPTMQWEVADLHMHFVQIIAVNPTSPTSAWYTAINYSPLLQIVTCRIHLLLHDKAVRP